MQEIFIQTFAEVVPFHFLSRLHKCVLALWLKLITSWLCLHIRCSVDLAVRTGRHVAHWSCKYLHVQRLIYPRARNFWIRRNIERDRSQRPVSARQEISRVVTANFRLRRERWKPRNGPQNVHFAKQLIFKWIISKNCSF